MPRMFGLWLASLIAVAVVTMVAMRAQVTPQSGSRIVSGGDVGFRVEGTDREGKALGTWMVRVDGRWVETVTKPTPRQAN